MTDEDDETTNPNDGITAQAVQNRIDDWLLRLRNLLDQTKRWAEINHWQVEAAESIVMDEELMRRVHLRPHRQPVLRLRGPNAKYAMFKPKGLWVIGANGRVDLYTSKGAFILVDRAEAYSPPQWTVFRPADNKEGKPYTPDLLNELT